LTPFTNGSEGSVSAQRSLPGRHRACKGYDRPIVAIPATRTSVISMAGSLRNLPNVGWKLVGLCRHQLTADGGFFRRIKPVLGQMRTARI